MLRRKGIKRKSKRRKKGEITKLKEQLWELCRQITFKRYGNDCFTCEKWKNMQGSNRQCGHYITSSLCSIELRYDLKNLRPQCFWCNINLAGNWVIFEKKLIAQFGELYVEELKQRNLATKGKMYPKEWFTSKISEYQQILNNL